MPLTKAFQATVLILWVLIIAAGCFYVPQQHIPLRLALAALPAVLLEAALYVAAGMSSMHERLASLAPGKLAAAITASAILPYLFSSIPLGAFTLRSFALLILLTAAVSFWWVIFPRRLFFQLAFLVLVAVVMLTPYLANLYPRPVKALPIEMLGRLMWIRIGILSAVLIGGMRGTNVGFLPSWRDWKAGVAYYVLFLPVAFALGMAFKFASLRIAPGWWWKLLPLFLGMLWVAAYSEEFFVRGLLQTWLCDWTRSERAGLLLASLVFGSLHLLFRAFPNWKLAIIAFAAGLFYGHAYLRTGSVRAPTVTHALVVVTWKLFFA